MLFGYFYYKLASIYIRMGVIRLTYREIPSKNGYFLPD